MGQRKLTYPVCQKGAVNENLPVVLGAVLAAQQLQCALTNWASHTGHERGRIGGREEGDRKVGQTW